MKLSQFIKELQSHETMYGDVDVVFLCDVPEEHYPPAVPAIESLNGRSRIVIQTGEGE